METPKEFTENEKGKLIVTPTMMNYLYSMSKWTMFFAVLGFIGVGLLVFASIMMMTIFSLISDLKDLPTFLGPFIGVVYIVLAAVYFFPVMYLYKFSSKCKQALLMKNQDFLENAFYNLKTHFAIVGYITISVMILYVLILIGAVLFGVMAASIAGA